MPEIPWRTGVYRWVNLKNGKVYVGGAYKSLVNREREHRACLCGGYHFNKHLQAAWNKYGAESFSFEVLERCRPSLVQEREQYWIDFHQASDRRHGYNRCPIAGSSLGKKAELETIEKMREIQRKRWESEEYRERMSLAHLGKPSGRKGKKATEETRAKQAAAWVRRKARGEQGPMLGKKHNEKTRRKMQEAWVRRKANGKGKPSLGRKASEETRAKMRRAWVLRKLRQGATE